MPHLASVGPHAGRPPKARHVVLRASRPSLLDLRFKGDPWVETREDALAVCLGDYLLSNIAATPLDHVAMNRCFYNLRMGQARRNYMRRIRRLATG